MGDEVAELLKPMLQRVRRRLEGGVMRGGALDLLSAEEVEAALLPVCDLHAYLASTGAPPGRKRRRADSPERDGGALLADYVRCRCAELPMRLQTEALVLRQHEQAHRQRTAELLALREFVCVAGTHAPQEATPGAARALDAEAVRRYTSAAEAEQRQRRARERIAELERSVTQAAVERVRCCQRMLLLSAAARAMLRDVSGGGGGGETADVSSSSDWSDSDAEEDVKAPPTPSKTERVPVKQEKEDAQ